MTAHASMFFRSSPNENLCCILDEQGHPTRQAPARPIRGSRSTQPRRAPHNHVFGTTVRCYHQRFCNQRPYDSRPFPSHWTTFQQLSYGSCGNFANIIFSIKSGNCPRSSQRQKPRSETYLQHFFKKSKTWLTRRSRGTWQKVATPLSLSVEAVEKVNLARIRRVGRKCNLSGCSVYDDLMLGRGQETPENHPLNVVRGFFYRLVSLNRGGFKIWLLFSMISRLSV